MATEKSGSLFEQMMKGIKGIHANSLLLDTIAKNSPNGVMDATKIIDAISKNSELAVFHKELDSLK